MEEVRMNISKLTKPVLWVITLSACAQALPMVGLVTQLSSRVSPQIVKRAGVAASGALSAFAGF